MISVCAWCGKSLGEKEPAEDRTVTYGICPECTDALKKGRSPIGFLIEKRDRAEERRKHCTPLDAVYWQGRYEAFCEAIHLMERLGRSTKDEKE